MAIGVNGVGSYGSTTGSPAGGATAGQLQDQFMKILLAQLQHQDPMAPMEEKDFFAQMAQFTSATEMGSMNGKMDRLIASLEQSSSKNSLLSAAALIGKSFTGVTDQGLVEGVVESVTLLEGKIFVKSGDTLLPVEGLLALGVVQDAD